MVAFILLVAIVIGCFAGHAVVAGLIVLAGYALWYTWAIWRRPYRPCWWCSGVGWRRGSDPGNTGSRGRVPFGRCWICHGTKSQVRWGVKWFRRKDYASIQAGHRGRNY